MEESRIQLLERGAQPEAIDVLNNQNEAVIYIRVMLPCLCVLFRHPLEEEVDDNFLPTSIENFDIILQSIGDQVECLDLNHQHSRNPTSFLQWEEYGPICESVHAHLTALNTVYFPAGWSHEPLMYFLFHLPRDVERIALVCIEPTDDRFIRMIPKCFPSVRKLVISGASTSENTEEGELEAVIATLIEGLRFLEDLSIMTLDPSSDMGALFEAINNKDNIIRLKLQGCELDEESCERLTEIIENSDGLIAIDLEDIRIAGRTDGLRSIIGAIAVHSSLVNLTFAGLETTEDEVITFDRNIEDAVLHNLVKNKVKARLGTNVTLGVWVEAVAAARNNLDVLGILFSDSICPTVFAKAALNLDGPHNKEMTQEEELEGLRREQVFQYLRNS